MKKLSCAGCGSPEIEEFNDILYRCRHCGALLMLSDNIEAQNGHSVDPLVAPVSPTSSVSPRGAGDWREKYRRRVQQNAGLLTDFIVDENRTLIKYEGTEKHLVIPVGVKAIGPSVFHFALFLESVVIRLDNGKKSKPFHFIQKAQRLGVNAGVTTAMRGSYI